MGKISLNVEHKIVEVQQHSHGADSITFIFDRYTNNGIDISPLRSKIILDTYNIIVSGLNNFLIQEATPTNIKLTWTLDRNTTAEVGVYNFQIVFVDSNDEIKLYTDVGRLKVNDSLDVEEVGFVKNLTLLQQWEERIKSDWDNKTDDLKSTIQALEDRIKELETNGGQGGFQLQIITLEESD